jgi:NADPH-dependent 2,4-dienoyl-CoA reductase/sulfur reductase-like enzyme
MLYVTRIPSSPIANLVSRKSVTSVDFAKKEVILEGGKDTIVYDKLILAPGATPRKLPVPGVDLENVYTVRGVENTKKVDAGELGVNAISFLLY